MRSRKQTLHHIAGNIGEAEITAGVTKGQALVVESQPRPEPAAARNGPAPDPDR